MAAPVDVGGGFPSSGTLAVADWSAYYDEHFDYVWRTLRRLGVPEAGLDDAAQEVFVVAFRRQAEFEGRSSHRTWLFGIAWNRARELARSARRRPEHELPDSIVAPADSDAETAAIRNQALRLVYRALEELAPERRAVLVMSDVEAMTAAEIAEVIGVPLNTAYSRIRLARKDFEAALKRCRARQTRSGR
jgi:RNA polymerase sigma-70 factor, ECF subfamily